VVLLTAVLGAALPLLPALRAEDRPDADARIDLRVRAWQPTAEERRLDDIAWAPDIRAGLRLAKEKGRPMFLFTYNGCTDRENALALQRC
jgi:hypothetical protein